VRLDAYVRVSKVAGRSGESFISPDLQSQQIEEYAKRHGHTLTLHEPELDVSGARMRRTVLDRILTRIRSGETDGIIVAKLNRFARSLVGGLTVIREIQDAGGALVTVAENIDFSTRSGRTYGNILLSLAEDELDRAREEWADAQRSAVERGVYTGSCVPPGFSKGDGRKLYPNSDAPTMREAFRMRKARHSLGEIVIMLNQKMPLPNEGKWLNLTVDRLLKNRIYRGELIRGELHNATAYEAIVSEPEWQGAQIEAKHSAPKLGKTGDGLLTGIIRCAGCRHVMSPNYATYKYRGKSYKTLVYRCRCKHGTGKCLAPSSITRAKIDDYVEKAFLREMAGRGLTGAETSEELDSALTTLGEMEAEQAEFAADTRAKAALGDTAYYVALETRASGIEATRAAVGALSAKPSDLEIGNWGMLSVDERRRILSAAVDTVFVRRGKTVAERSLILWSGELKGDVPVAGGNRSSPLASFDW
jgi:DNA invertase Pin-like site-specific DNA recombinase